MIISIGSKTISKIKLTGKQFDVHDSKLKGFLIRVNPSGSMSYVCQYKRGKRITIGRVGVLTPVQARDKAREVLACASRGEDPKALLCRKSAITLKEFIEKQYLPWAKAHRKSGLLSVARIRRCFFKSFANKPLNEITAVLIDSWRTQRLNNGISTETINRDVATFKAAISKAVEWELIEKNLLRTLKLFKVDHTPTVRYLDSHEEKRLRDALDARDQLIKNKRANGNQWREERGYPVSPLIGDDEFSDHLKPMVLLSMNTGMRQGEVFHLTWKNVDLENANLTISSDVAKSGRTRYIPLNSEALDMLTQWQKQTISTGLVFPSKTNLPFNNVRKSWCGLLEDADIEGFRWHDMRHHFASRLVMVGVDLNTVRELLGHSDIKMTLRYAHLAPEHKANAVAKLMQKCE